MQVKLKPNKDRKCLKEQPSRSPVEKLWILQSACTRAEPKGAKASPSAKERKPSNSMRAVINSWVTTHRGRRSRYWPAFACQDFRVSRVNHLPSGVALWVRNRHPQTEIPCLAEKSCCCWALSPYELLQGCWVTGWPCAHLSHRRTWWDTWKRNPHLPLKIKVSPFQGCKSVDFLQCFCSTLAAGGSMSVPSDWLGIWVCLGSRSTLFMVCFWETLNFWPQFNSSLYIPPRLSPSLSANSTNVFINSVISQHQTINCSF